jgi:hypothetical protein
MDVVEVQYPSASGGEWMWRKSHMEAANSPQRYQIINQLLPLKKFQKGQMAQPVENFEKTAAGFFNSRSDFHFIFRLGNGGSGMATATGQILSFSYGVWYFLLKKTNLSIYLA